MTEKFIIKGLGSSNGKSSKGLKGTFPVYGAKNALMPLLASSFLFKDKIRITNTPPIEDAKRIFEIVEKMGMKVSVGKDFIEIDTSGLNSAVVDHELGSRLRSSIILIGPILSRMGKVNFPMPGGCVIGKRPIDMFLSSFEKMGSKIDESKEGDKFKIKAKNKNLKGTEIFMRVQSVTLTETLIMAATLAEGETVIKNAAMEPEIIALSEFLVENGAKISGAGSPTIKIKGRNGKPLSFKKTYRNIPDRIEAGSAILLASSIPNSNVKIDKCRPDHLESLLQFIEEAGVKLKKDKNSVTIKTSSSKNKLNPLIIKTHEYPGFPTDLQSQMGVFLTQCSGESSIFESVFESRFSYVKGLTKMGADAKVWDTHRATIKGKTKLKGKTLKAPDLRGGFAYVMAAALATGKSEISDVYYIDRGYSDLETRLQNIGLDIERK